MAPGLPGVPPIAQPPAWSLSPAAGAGSTTGLGLPLGLAVGPVGVTFLGQAGPGVGATGPCKCVSRLNRTSSTQ